MNTKDSISSASYPEAFCRIVTFVLDAEGGYVNDPADPGGETKFGISKRAHPAVDIAGLTIGQATRIYFDKYWQHYRCGDMPSWAAALLFDAVVQHRPGDATRLFQRALRVKPDGIIGDITVAATHGAKGDVISRYFTERAVFYSDLVRGDRVRAVFIRGWMARLFNLQAFVLCEISESLEAE